VLADYDEDQLALVAEFLRRVAEATRDAREHISPQRFR
jgi:ABC-type nitrate/sulfonate/bicarbonate transport system substrate-binding protein